MTILRDFPRLQTFNPFYTVPGDPIFPRGREGSPAVWITTESKSLLVAINNTRAMSKKEIAGRSQIYINGRGKRHPGLVLQAAMLRKQVIKVGKWPA